MKVIVLGAAGFIGTNLVLGLLREKDVSITAVDKKIDYFANVEKYQNQSFKLVISDLSVDTDYDNLVKDFDVVYHLISTTVPTTSNHHIVEELKSNVILSANLFEACVRQKVKKVVFISSGGTVYGKEVNCPLNENTPTNPISSYGIQKVTIEKLLYLYNYMYGLDYRIIRLANPYGPYQRPNGVLGAVTTFTYKALKGEEIQVYGDGSVVRDFIYIDDAVKGVFNIVNGESNYRTFNLGCGYGTSIKQVLDTVSKTLNLNLNISYLPGRAVDVPVNFLDIKRYENTYGELKATSLTDGISKTAAFMKDYYNL